MQKQEKVVEGSGESESSNFSGSRDKKTDLYCNKWERGATLRKESD